MKNYELYVIALSKKTTHANHNLFDNFNCKSALLDDDNFNSEVFNERFFCTKMEHFRNLAFSFYQCWVLDGNSSEWKSRVINFHIPRTRFRI